MRTLRGAVAVALAATMLASPALAAAPNGIAAKPPAEIAAAAVAAIRSSSSVRLYGLFHSAGGAVKLNLRIVSGKGVRGTLALNGASCRLVVIGKTAYLNGSRRFWVKAGNAPAEVAGLLAGRWFKLAAGSVPSSFSALLHLGQLFAKATPADAHYRKGSTTIVHGRPAIAVSDAKGPATLYVATTGKPYPLELANSSATGGAIYFGSFNQRVTLAAPAGALTVP